MPEPTHPAAVDPATWRGRRVLLTGHTGFKGSWLALWLTRMGAEVTGLSLGVPTRPALFDLARVGDGLAASVEGDVRDLEAVRAVLAARRPEVVLHLAAQPMVRAGLRDPVATYETNVMGTVNLLDAVGSHGGGVVRAVVVVTSDKCYENTGHGRPFAEGDPLGGHDPYSSSKACAEWVTEAYRQGWAADPDGPRVATARAGNVIGGGDWGADRLVPDVVRAAAAGQPVAVRNPEAVRPWQHVLEPLAGYLLLAQGLLAGAAVDAAWNFGPAPGDARSVRWVADRLSALWPGELEWALDPGPHPPEAALLALDSTRAAEHLGWRPRWGLERALEATVAWHAAHLAGEDARETTLGQLDAWAAS